MNIGCDYGCTKTAEFYNATTNMHRCSKNVNSCKGMIEIKKIYSRRKEHLVPFRC